MPPNTRRERRRAAPSDRRILVDIEDTLDDDLGIHRVPFTYSREYGMDTPNPFVHIQDFGKIDLPLSERDAQALISFHEKDASQPTNSCEFSNCDVHFMNPQWEEWVENTVAKDARTLLGLPPCECEFGKMMLLSAGSAAQPLQRFRQSRVSEDRLVLGTVEILLPSCFTGGDVTVAYPAIPYERTTHSPEESRFSTPVLGFRAGAVQTIAPLRSGYRLSLTYNLVHSGNDSHPPTPSDLAAAKEKLRGILNTWKTDALSSEVIPIKLAHKYTAGPSFSSMSLCHPDDMLLSCLQSLTADLHLRLLIVHVEHHRSSFVSIQGDDHSDIEDEEDSIRPTQRFYRSQNELMRFLELYDDENVYSGSDGAENSSGGMVVKQVVDMEGMPVTVDNLDFPAQNIIHDVYKVEEEDQSGWEQDYMRGRLDFKDFDCNVNDKDEVVSIFYFVKSQILRPCLLFVRTGDYLEVWKDTLLVLCRDPSWTIKAGDVFDYVCDHLESSQSPTAGTNEIKLVDALLQCCKTPQPRKRPAADKETKLKRAAVLLVKAASRWNDIDLFFKAAEACDIRRKINRIGSDGFVTAYHTFPWLSVKAFFSDAITQGESNPDRTYVLRALKQAAEVKANADVVKWCQEIEESVYLNLKPVDETQVNWLVELIKERGVSFFRDRFFESFKCDQNLSVRFWLSLSQNLVQNQHAFDSLARETFDALISELAALAVQCLPAFPLKEEVAPPPAEKHVYEDPDDSDIDSDGNAAVPEYQMDIDLIKDIIGLCTQTNNLKHCGTYFDALHHASRDALGSGQKYPPWHFYRSLAPEIDALLTSTPDVDASSDPWASFFQAAAQILVCHSPLTADSDLKLLTMIITRAGGVMTLETILTAEVVADLTKKDLPSFERLVVHLFSNLLPAPSASISRQSLAGIIFSCVQAVIENAPISTVKKVEKLLKFCFTVGIGRQSYPLVLDRILAQSAANDPEGNTYLKDVLVPMILHLKSILTDHGISLIEQPCKTFCLTVMQRYTSIIVGKKPPHTIHTALTSFGCGCNYCDDVKAFFKNGVQLTHHVCAVAKVRAHVEEKLKTQRVRIEAAGVEWYTLRTGSPHSLVITKPISMSLYPAWEINSRRGVELLDEMGDEKTQKVILGEHYLWIHDVLHGGPGTSDTLHIESLPSRLLAPSGIKRMFDDDIDSEDGSEKKKIKLEE